MSKNVKTPPPPAPKRIPKLNQKKPKRAEMPQNNPTQVKTAQDKSKQAKTSQKDAKGDLN